MSNRKVSSRKRKKNPSHDIVEHIVSEDDFLEDYSEEGEEEEA